MIRVVLLGRVGNNLFQYAFGRMLAERHGVPLVLDASWFNREGWRQVSCLERLGLGARVVRRFSPGARVLLKVTGKHYWEYRGLPVIRERGDDHTYSPGLASAPEDCVVMGYFQSPLYFGGMEEALRREIDLRAALPGDIIVPESLSEESSVAVHVRRTDYLLHQTLNVCRPAYYETAMKRMRDRLPAPRFHIFSDDSAWCRDHFRSVDVQVMDCHRDPLHDLHLMSVARHHIIANSSYSWWAAWLGRKPGQRVLCPPRWFTDGITAPIGEKLCSGWETVEFEAG